MPEPNGKEAMKKNIAEKWISALRSKKYKQGRHALKYKTKDGTRHCCLGVLCELYQKAHKRKLPTATSTGGFNMDIPRGARFTTFADCGIDLPEKVMKWAGMRSEVGFLRSTGENLATMNDERVSFKKIADIIEDRIKEL